jgi:hypothetical protein
MDNIGVEALESRVKILESRVELLELALQCHLTLGLIQTNQIPGNEQAVEVLTNALCTAMDTMQKNS